MREEEVVTVREGFLIEGGSLRCERTMSSSGCDKKGLRQGFLLRVLGYDKVCGVSVFNQT